MSVGALPLSDGAIAAQGNSKPAGPASPPHKRTIVAASDAVTRPEPR